MPKTLAGAKPILEKDLNELLKDAAYEAFMTMNGGGSGTIANAVKSANDKAAKKFADKFAEKSAKPLADAIYKFVMEIGINLTNPSTLISTSIMSPSPVAGIVPITGFTIQ